MGVDRAQEWDLRGTRWTVMECGPWPRVSGVGACKQEVCEWLNHPKPLLRSQHSALGRTVVGLEEREAPNTEMLEQFRPHIGGGPLLPSNPQSLE